jgi:YegS/Rv2252/BmrU family lipid kinase
MVKGDYYRERWLVVLNPNAGKGKGGKDWDIISSLLKRGKLVFSARFTEGPYHAISLTREGLKEGFRKIITIGGDGTLNEVINGIFSNEACPTSDVTLAMIPVGTGNDWGKMFGIHPDYEEAIRIIGENKVMEHDVGTVDYHEGSVKKTRYFINIAGLGFESLVVRKSNIQKAKGRGGKAIYFYNLLTSLLSYRNTRVEIIIDGKKINASVFSVNIGNGKFCGGGMRQTPDAVPNDGMLDVTIIHDIGKLEIIRNLKILYDGSILSHPKIDGYRCKKVEVNSDKVIYSEADGESLGHTPLAFGIIPGSIKIIYGTDLIQSV